MHALVHRLCTESSIMMNCYFMINIILHNCLSQELETKLRTNGIKVEETNIDQSLLLSTIIKSEVVNNTGGQNDVKKVRCNYNLHGSLLDVRVLCLLLFLCCTITMNFCSLKV